MNSMKRALVDLSSTVWKCLLYGVDQEFGRKVPNEQGKLVQVNSAIYGYENSMAQLTTMMKDLDLVPRDVILVMEGKNSKAYRQAIHPGYKSGRDKSPEQYAEFNKARDMVIEAFLNVGANLFWQDGGVEADDVLGYMAKHLEGEVWIISGDKDLAQLVGGNVHHYRDGIRDDNPLPGGFPHRFIPVYFALCGDSTDKIPGAKGFGDTSWLKLLSTFGEECLPALEGLIKTRTLQALQEDVGELKELQKVIDDAKGVYMSYELGRLLVDKVNTAKRPLQSRAGVVRNRSTKTHPLLAQYAGQVSLCHAGNYDQVLAFFRKHLNSTPYFGLDIETSTPPESDEWLENMDKSEDKTPIDVFGAQLTGTSISFGRNVQYTVYLTNDHVEEPGVKNLSLEQVHDFIDAIPREKVIYVHNGGYELPVLRNTFELAPEAPWYGFLPNVRDTLVGSSYVDENRSKGLKDLSRDLLNYNQVTYDEVTTKRYTDGEWDGKGKLLQRVTSDDEGAPDTLVVQHKMNQLTARHVLSYGADDSICTVGLAGYFRIWMEIENTWSVYNEVETYPAYLTAKAFVDGADFSLEHMRGMEKDDDAAYAAAWPVLRDYLVKIGFKGTVTPRMVTDAEAEAIKAEAEDGKLPSTILQYNAAGIKDGYLLLTGEESFSNSTRRPDKLAKLIEQRAMDSDADWAPRVGLYAKAVAEQDLATINELIAASYSGEPHLDLGSPKQIAHLLYDVIGIPVVITGDLAPNDYKFNRPLVDALRLHRRWRMGEVRELSDNVWSLVRKKAKANDDAIDWALAFCLDAKNEAGETILDAETQAALRAFGVMKKIYTRRNLFYKNYWALVHWKDGKIHASAKQCAAVTRRYSYSTPNLQQLPKKGEAVRFRGGFKPHKKNAVICSIDFGGQELRLAADCSGDPNMLACYVGDHLKDLHSITAAGAMKLKWGAEAVRHYVLQYASHVPQGPEYEYLVFKTLHGLGKGNEDGKRADDLRKDSKNVNFTAQFGGQALKISETLIMRVSDAQLFLDARAAMFPLVEVAAKKAEDECRALGYATTYMGARRHLREAIASDDGRTASRAARQAWNMRIQGSAGEMTKLGMARLWLSGVLFRLDARFIAQIHDELVTSVTAEHAVEFIKIKHECMTQKYSTMNVPVVGSISLGPDFADQHECGDEFNEASINKALALTYIGTYYMVNENDKTVTPKAAGYQASEGDRKALDLLTSKWGYTLTEQKEFA